MLLKVKNSSVIGRVHCPHREGFLVQEELKNFLGGVASREMAGQNVAHHEQSSRRIQWDRKLPKSVHEFPPEMLQGVGMLAFRWRHHFFHYLPNGLHFPSLICCCQRSGKWLTKCRGLNVLIIRRRVRRFIILAHCGLEHTNESRNDLPSSCVGQRH